MRILCAVFIKPQNYNNYNSNVLAIKETWGKRCDILHFVGPQDPSLPSIKVNCDHNNMDQLLCQKKMVFTYFYNKYKHLFDWILVVYENMYVVIENLQHLVSHYSANEPIWFGCPFRLTHSNDITFMRASMIYK